MAGCRGVFTERRENVNGPPALGWFCGWMPWSVHGKSGKCSRSSVKGGVTGQKERQRERITVKMSAVTDEKRSCGAERAPARTERRENVNGPPASGWFYGWMPWSIHGKAGKRERSPRFGLVLWLDAGECSRKVGKTRTVPPLRVGSMAGCRGVFTERRENVNGPPVLGWLRGLVPGSVHGKSGKCSRSSVKNVDGDAAAPQLAPTVQTC